jgi:DNA-binding CsgD family transcriptional regulator
VFLQITPSERDALGLLANGTTTDEIARCLGVTVSEVEACLDALFAKMGTANPLDAVAAAFRRGLLPLDRARMRPRGHGTRGSSYALLSTPSGRSPI